MPVIARSSALSLTRQVVEAAALEGLRGEWLDLLARSASNEVTLTPTWLLAWWHVFGRLGGRRLAVVLFRGPEGRLVGLAPLLRRRHWHFRALPFRRLEALGSGECERDEICSDYLNILAERGAEPAVADGLARAVAGGELGGWDELLLPAMDGTGPMPALLAAAFRRAGVGAELTPASEAPYLALPATWADYLRGQPQADRYRINRALRDLEAWSGGDWLLERPTTPEELARARESLIDLHRRRWEGQGGGTFRSPHFLAFHDRLMPELFTQGALDLLVLRVRGEAVAAVYNFVWDDKVSFYQCGRSLDVPKGARPGVALMALAIRSAIEAGRREFDFLEGTSRFKMQFTRTTRPLVRVRAYRPSLLERARLLAEVGRGVARRLRRGARALAARLGRAKKGPEGPPNAGIGPLFHATHE